MGLHGKQLIPKATMTDDDTDHDPQVGAEVNILPHIPRHQVFEAVVTHVDDKAVVWVVPKEDLARMAEVTANCRKCKEEVASVEIGCLYVARLGRKPVRARVLREIWDGSLQAIDVDSGEVFFCDPRHVFVASRSLHTPPLALPLKLYGVKKAVDDINKHNIEETAGPSFRSVTVAVLDLKVATLPLPANVYYAKNGANYGGNLAFTMLKRGLVRVITNYEDWFVEFNDHGLEWLLGIKPKQHVLDFLPFPLPLASGTWLSVRVEGLEYQLRDGEEVEPTIYYRDANKIACRVVPTNHLLNYGQDESLQMEIGESMRITEAQVDEIFKAFAILTRKLQAAAKTAPSVESLTKMQPVLAFYSYGEEGEWCRANLTGEPCPSDHHVWVFFVDFGHRQV